MEFFLTSPLFFCILKLSKTSTYNQKGACMRTFLKLIGCFWAFMAFASPVLGATWSGGGVDNFASTPANWTGSFIPSSGDSIVFDATSSKNCVWDINDTYSSLLIAGGYLGSLTITSRIILSGNPATIDYNTVHNGYATYYAATGAGACSFDASPSNLMVAALSNADYHGSLSCGSFIRVSGPTGDISVRIVDKCPDCEPGRVDLSQEAFAMIADPFLGTVPIAWQFIEAPVTGNISYRFHAASSQWWIAVQLLNHRHPVAKLEMLDSFGTWVAFDRTDYNYFIYPSGMGLGPFTIRLTDIFGHSITDSSISFVPGGTVQGGVQFPSL
jgi:expansin